MSKGTVSRTILKANQEDFAMQEDLLAQEEPLAIQLAYGKGDQRTRKTLAVTMRTPGDDMDLVLGFLFTEGMITRAKDVLQMRYVTGQLDETAQENSLLVDLHPDLNVDMERLNRHFYTSSSCGICGKASIEMVQTISSFLLPKGQPTVDMSLLFSLSQKWEGQQTLFAQTGGIHAAALFDTDGQLQLMREDVGRHNALDKLIGAALKIGKVPLSDSIVLVSGRAGFELVQKSVMAGVPILAAVGAASSLAVELAEEQGMTLVGFLRKERGNVYCGAERIVFESV